MNEITPDNVARTDNGVKIEEAHFHYLQDGMRLANHMVEPMAQRFKINESTGDLQVKMVYNDIDMHLHTKRKIIQSPAARLACNVAQELGINLRKPPNGLDGSMPTVGERLCALAPASPARFGP